MCLEALRTSKGIVIAPAISLVRFTSDNVELTCLFKLFAVCNLHSVPVTVSWCHYGSEIQLEGHCWMRWGIFRKWSHEHDCLPTQETYPVISHLHTEVRLYLNNTLPKIRAGSVESTDVNMMHLASQITGSDTTRTGITNQRDPGIPD
jgi:hypothetical protein